MERRTFIGVVAAVLGWPLIRRVVGGTARSQRAEPRWEWEVGEWIVKCRTQEGFAWAVVPTSAGDVFRPPTIPVVELTREWTGHAVILSSELNDIGAAIQTLNSRKFLGVKSRHLQAVRWGVAPLGNGLYEATITLMERNHDGTAATINSDGRRQTFMLYKTSDFYRVFRGEHAVVSIGGKAV